MSFFEISPATVRLQRSELAVPGSNPDMFEKAANSEADFVFLDCEDAIAPQDKAKARSNIISALNEIDWKAKGKTVSVRINGLDTHYMYRDVVEIVEQAGHHLDTILIPKVGVPEDVYVVDCLVSQIEQARGTSNRLGLECLIETALGMSNVDSIARTACRAGSRLEALHFGVADYAASCRARTVVIGGLNPDYPGDQWHASLQRMLVACRAYGLRAIDGPYGDFNDPEGFIAAAKRVAAMGYEGKWAIHPSQIELANRVMSPPEAEVDRARRVLAALEEAEKAGKGAASLDGKLIDAASARMANNIVEQSMAIAARSSDRED